MIGFAADWPAPANIRTLMTTRSGGVSSGDYASLNLGMNAGDDLEAVRENRSRVVAQVGLEPRWLNQVHGMNAVKLPHIGETPVADAAWTDQAGVVCAVTIADCLPVCFARRDGTAVAVAHAGWKGLSAGVLETTIQAMGEGRDLMAWLGAAIGPERFEVGDEVRAAFLASDTGAGLAFRDRGNGKWLCDLYALARRRLNRTGVTAVFGGGFCTYGEPDRFFSHRRATHAGTRTGRMAALIWME